MRGAYSETTSSAGGCFPRGNIFPPYLDIRVVICILGTHLDFRELFSVDGITGTLVSHADVSDTAT